MAITHSLVATDWTVDSATGNIRYTGDDHHETSPSYATVIELHRWLQGLADDQAPADTSDEVYIAMLNPSTRSTDNIITLINGYNIDAAAAEHLYDGSIIQSDGDEIWDGIVNFGNADVQIQIIQDGAIISDDYWNYNIGGTATGGSGTQLADTGASWTTDQWIGYTVKNTTEGCHGIANDNDGTTIDFASGELHNGTNQDFANTDTYLIGQPLNPNATQGISHRFMIKVRENGCDIDGRRLIGICRRMGNTYAEFKINGTSRGNNVLALTDSADLNCTTANTTVIGTTWDTDFSGEDQGFQQFDVNQDSTNEDYYGKLTWINSHTINDLYERAKGETEDGSGYTVHGLGGEVFRGVTHSVGYDTETGGISISDYDYLAWGTLIDHGAVTGGSFSVGDAIHEDGSDAWRGRILAIDTTNTALVVDVTSGTVGNGETFSVNGAGSVYAATSSAPTAVTGGGVLHVLAHDATNDILYVQVTKGTMADDETTLYYAEPLTAADTTDYVVTETSVEALTSRTISTPYIGVSTGTAIIGGYGVGIDNAKLTQNDKVTDLSDTVITPPNNVTNTVTGCIVGEDYVFVAPWDGTSTDANGDPAVDSDQMSTNATYNSSGVSTISVTAIPGSTPNSGTIRVVNDEGFHVQCWYSSYDDGTDDFTLIGTDTFVDGDVTVGSDNIASTDHGFKDQIPVQLTTTGTLPTGLALATTYYIIRVDDDNLKFAADLADCVAGTAVDITAASGGGTHTITPNYMDFSGSGLNDSATSGNDCYVTYIDKLADATSETFQAVYDNDLNLVLLARDGGSSPIKQHIVEWSFTNTSQSTGLIRTSDT
jgi:hypothetical protein